MLQDVQVVGCVFKFEVSACLRLPGHGAQGQGVPSLWSRMQADVLQTRRFCQTAISSVSAGLVHRDKQVAFATVMEVRRNEQLVF